MDYYVLILLEVGTTPKEKKFPDEAAYETWLNGFTKEHIETLKVLYKGTSYPALSRARQGCPKEYMVEEALQRAGGDPKILAEELRKIPGLVFIE